MCDIACDAMFGQLAKIKEIVLTEVEKFRQKGALSPENAMSIEELGLSPNFKGLMDGPLGLLGIFVEVDGKYYLSEKRLKEVEEQISSRPIRRWLRHTASVPKGLLRFYVLKLLKDKPMSGSEIMEAVEKQSGGQWKPSPGSVYPLLTWLRENDYTKELPKEVTGIKRYMLTEKGEKFFEENARFKDKLTKKIGSVGPMFFLRMGLHAEGLQELEEPARRFVTAIINLGLALRKNLTEQTITEIGQFLNDTAEKIEGLNKKINGR